jgi:O-antigen biosynthesis protein WbqP
MKRFFDLFFGILLLVLLSLPMLFIALMILVSSRGKILYWSDRVGKNSIIYKMPKFRSMLENTPEIATHALENPDLFMSPVGGFLRKYSLDELPQLFSVIKGDMSLVGPRPALYNQDDLIELRQKNDIDKLLPGVSGWAQINGRDNLSIDEKVKLDLEYMQKKSTLFDIKVLWLTIIKVLNREGISH